MIARGWPRVVVLAGAVGLALAGCSDDADRDERIRSYDVLVEAQPDGSVRVTETIEYDFGDEDRHGIDRDLPQRLPYRQEQDRVTEISDVAVESPTGAPVDVDSETDGGSLVLRIGDEDVDVTGLQTYVISYAVADVATSTPDGDEIAWNAVGTGWEVPVDDVRVRLELPVAATSSSCVRGEAGSDEPCDVSDDGDAVVAGADGLGAEQGVTVTALLPAGSVTTDPVLRDTFSPARAFGLGPVPLGVAVLVLLALVVPVLLRVRRGQDAREDTPASLTTHGPPGDHRPAELGTLFDGRAGAREVTATLLDLARRGVLRLEEVDVDAEGEPVERKQDAPPVNWHVVRTGTALPDDARGYERDLLEVLLGDDDARLLSQAYTARSSELARVRAAMHGEVVGLGWFTQDPAVVRRGWYLRGTALLVAGVVLTVLLAVWTTFAWTGVAVVLSGVLVLGVTHLMPVRTAKGRRLRARVAAYRQQLTSTTPDAAQVDSQLPYAVALGVEGRWKDALSGPDAPSPPSWYATSAPGSPVVWPWLFVLTSTGGSPTATGATPTSSGVGAGAGGGGGGSW